MSASKERTRVAGKCANCHAVFAAELREDGTVRRLGQKRGCSCGDGDLRPLT